MADPLGISSVASRLGRSPSARVVRRRRLARSDPALAGVVGSPSLGACGICRSPDSRAGTARELPLGLGRAADCGWRSPAIGGPVALEYVPGSTVGIVGVGSGGTALTTAAGGGPRDFD